VKKEGRKGERNGRRSTPHADHRVCPARLGTPADRSANDVEERSPLNRVDAIRRPLLIGHGANDPRVKKAESEQIVKALHQRGFPVEYLLAPNEGHGFAHPVNNLARMAATERFLARHVGGRCQEAVSPEVARRLAEITVDVNTLATSGGDRGRV